MYKLGGKLTLSDLYEFNKSHSFRSLGRIKIILLLIIVCVGFGVTIYSDIVGVLHGEKTLYNTHFMYFFLFLCIFIIIFLFQVRRNIKKLYETNAFFSEEKALEISEDRIVETSKSTSVELTKEKIYKVCITKKAIYLYISNMQAYIIPYHFFNDACNFEEVKEFVKKYFGK